jgi:NADPH-dependent 2,4-dienoyl-CoA reductase/sulfur reductase-like enzyme/peroxiredoxin family protein/rhodanese-related sulfurtransferase/TusA-related sulfurtransferase
MDRAGLERVMKVVIVGGVAGGASVAARLRRLDESAQVVVIERTKYVSFANCGLPYHIGGVIKDRNLLLLQSPESLRASLNIDVRIGHEVLSIDRKLKSVRIAELDGGREYAETYDVLVLAPGATPVRPDLPGIEDPRVMVLRNVEDMDAIKRRVDDRARGAIVIGGGYIGVEMAESLRQRGLDVDLVEMVDQIMPPLDKEMVAPLEDHMKARGVRLHLGTAAAAFRTSPGGRIQAELKSGAVLTADLVVLAAGVRPDVKLAKAAGLDLGPRGGIKVDAHMRTSDPAIYAVGDAVEVTHTVVGDSWLIPLAGPANRQGRVAADNICGRNSTYASTQGTAIVKVFNMTAGGTGATEKNLIRAGLPFRKVHLHPSGHAGYYPGSAPMHIKVLFAPDSGRLLGAQVVGFDGVDKRIDVFATGIRAGMTVYDLEHLELAYAPPYGSAKDPVNMAGFVAANLLRGDVTFWHAEDYPEKTEGAVLVDVRGPGEFEGWHIPGSINIPLGEVRRRMGELPKEGRIRVYCKVGFRSYLAYRALRQAGFTDVATLAGGVTTFRCIHRALEPEPEEEPVATLAYAEEEMAVPGAAAKPSGQVAELDCTGIQCPGPIMRIKDAVAAMNPGDELLVRVSDPGFVADGPAWCRRNGHELTDLREEAGGALTARIRKGVPRAVPVASSAAVAEDRKTLVVFSGDLDKVMAAFVIANGALAMGSQVTMFFTFWGLNALRKSPAPDVPGKSVMERLFAAMMPGHAGDLKLSRMHMGGAGTAMMMRTMEAKNVPTLPSLIESARQGGARLIACAMSMEVMGLRREELLEGVDVGGVAAFLADADKSGTTLFI